MAAARARAPFSLIHSDLELSSRDAMTRHAPAMLLPNAFETLTPNSPLETRTTEPSHSLPAWSQRSPAEGQATGIFHDLPPTPPAALMVKPQI